MGPETALIAAAVSASAAAAAQGVAAHQQSKAAEASAEYEAGIARLNERNARLEAGQAEELQRREGRRVLGDLRAGVADRGIDLASSSAWDLYRQSAIDAEADALAIRRQGEQQARGYANQAAGASFAAKQHRQGARIGAAASALGVAAAGSEGLSTYKYRTAGRGTTAGATG